MNRKPLFLWETNWHFDNRTSLRTLPSRSLELLDRNEDSGFRGGLDRGSSATHHRSGGNQPAYQSMINRRFMIVPPALSSRGHPEQLDEQARNSRACSLKWRT